MKLFVSGFFASSLLFVSLVLTGCGSPSADPFFTDNPDSAAAMTDSPYAPKNRSLADVARFHVGETVSVASSGAPESPLPHQELIKEDGNITLPLIDTIRAAGKTAGELQNEIHDLYVPKYYVRLTVTVTPGDLVYYVRGEVKGPGRQLYVGEITVSKAITSAGDFTDFASHKNVLLIRANGEQTKVNVDKILAGKIADPPVHPGDQIVVSRSIW